MMGAFAWVVAAGMVAGTGSRIERDADRPVGSYALPFEVLDESGMSIGRADWAGDKVAVVAFLKSGCPLSELYGPIVAEIAARYRGRGVVAIGAYPNGSDRPGNAGDLALREARPETAARLGVTRTPEVVVIDGAGRIRYRGRVDDRYGLGSRRPEARSNDLADALDDVLAGRPVRTPETAAEGCPIDGPGAAGGPSIPTYARDVAPILDRRCGSCHRAGQSAPFALSTYRQAAERAGAIAEAVEDGRMPPWDADPRYGHFRNDPTLGPAERRAILGWARGGRPMGDPRDLPAPIERSEGWAIPRPDAVVMMPRPFAVPARGEVEYQTFEVDPGFHSDRWVTAAEIRPGNRRVVHHCNVFLKRPGGAAEVDATGVLGSACLAELTPGSPPMVLPEGMAKRIPKGWHLLFVVHYEPIGTEQVDRTSIGLTFARPEAVRREVATNVLIDPELTIAPGEPDHRVERSVTFDRDVLLVAMFPHMHLRGKSFRYEAIRPGGRVDILLDVPRYDFRRQDRYELARPIRLAAGTTLRCTATFDNSAANPNNPDPAATVVAGRRSTDEMFNGFFEVALADDDHRLPPGPVANALDACRRHPAPAATLALAGVYLGVRAGRRRPAVAA